ncbi:MAG TPA: hypothetical protein VLK65_18135 [Vicinamibacteria bacterium]|nr:hypothetical protein [Vicinamibacteria bacterium]
MSDKASPFRLVDLRYAFSDDGRVVSSFESRVRMGASSFIGGEVVGERLGLSFDTARIEMGASRDDESSVLEGGYRARRFLAQARAVEEGGSWKLATEGALRLSKDFELLFGFREDFDDSVPEPPRIGAFIATGLVPRSEARTREDRFTSAGLLYQRGTHLELLADAQAARLRTEAGFDVTKERLRMLTHWTRAPLELKAEASYERTRGRLPHRVGDVALGADVRLGSRLLATAASQQTWEPGLVRLAQVYGTGLVLFGRRHTFTRGGDAAKRVRELQRQAFELGYNERRVYDTDGLRALRERLGISGAREILSNAIDALYRAQVRERNVEQLGFLIEWDEHVIPAISGRTYRLFIALPWPLGPPWRAREDHVDFVRIEGAYREETFSSVIRSVTREVQASVFLNREMSLSLAWESPGRTPEEIARDTSRPSRITLNLVYEMGR